MFLPLIFFQQLNDDDGGAPFPLCDDDDALIY